MRNALRLIPLLALLLASAAPTGAAAPTQGTLDTAGPVLLQGDVTADVRAAHLLARATPGLQPFIFEGRAEAATLTEHYSNNTIVDHPSRHDTDLFRYEESQGTSHATFIAPTLRAIEVRPGATAFIAPVAGEHHDVAVHRAPSATLHASEFTNVAGDRVDETRQRGGAAAVGDLEFVYEGPHVVLSASDSVARVTGDFSIHLFNLTVEIVSDSGRRIVETGAREISDGGKVSRERISNATLILRDATFDLTPGGQALLLLAPSMSVTLDGDLVAPEASGVLRADRSGKHVASKEEVHADGRLTLHATPSEEAPDRMRLATSGDLRAINLPLQDERTLVVSTLQEHTAWWAAGTSLLVIGAGTVVVLRNRALEARILRRPPARLDASKAAEEAVIALQAGEYATALAHLDTAIAAEPESSDLLVDRGYCLEKLGDTQGARLAYERALLADPGRAETHYYYARALCALGLTTTALSHVGRALALDERLREQARDDPAFHSLRDHPQFLSQIGA